MEMPKRRRHAPVTSTMLEIVKEQLETTDIPALEIYRHTGVTPNRQWAIKTGQTIDPGVNSIEAIYTYFNERTFEDLEKAWWELDAMRDRGEVQ